jgi:hypothetical protein
MRIPTGRTLCLTPTSTDALAAHARPLCVIPLTAQLILRLACPPARRARRVLRVCLLSGGVLRRARRLGGRPGGRSTAADLDLDALSCKVLSEQGRGRHTGEELEAGTPSVRTRSEVHWHVRRKDALSERRPRRRPTRTQPSCARHGYSEETKCQPIRYRATERKRVEEQRNVLRDLVQLKVESERRLQHTSLRTISLSSADGGLTLKSRRYFPGTRMLSLLKMKKTPTG